MVDAGGTLYKEVVGTCNAAAKLRRLVALGVVLPVSKSCRADLATPAISANWSCVIPAAALAAFK